MSSSQPWCSRSRAPFSLVLFLQGVQGGADWTLKLKFKFCQYLPRWIYCWYLKKDGFFYNDTAVTQWSDETCCHRRGLLMDRDQIPFYFLCWGIIRIVDSTRCCVLVSFSPCPVVRRAVSSVLEQALKRMTGNLQDHQNVIFFSQRAGHTYCAAHCVHEAFMFSTQYFEQSVNQGT